MLAVKIFWNWVNVLFLQYLCLIKKYLAILIGWGLCKVILTLLLFTFFSPDQHWDCLKTNHAHTIAKVKWLSIVFLKSFNKLLESESAAVCWLEFLNWWFIPCTQQFENYDIIVNYTLQRLNYLLNYRSLTSLFSN